MLRRLALVSLLAAVVLGAPATASAAPSRANPFGDDVRIIPAWLLAPPGYWGGQYRISTGQSVTVYTSNDYPVDERANQALADFLARAVHGSEIESVEIYRVTSAGVEQLCGSALALACYSPAEDQIVVPAEAIDNDISAEAALLHEYGHHVAFHRDNAPWPAVDYGTKRWATYENICREQRRGNVFPGDEQDNYQLNPGEGFAEAYRVLNEQRLGLRETPWDAVSRRFIPDSTALQLIQQDVLQPWRRGTTTRLTGRLKSGKSRTYRIPTPLDGNFNVSGPAGLRLTVLGPSSRIASGRRVVGTEVCGQRTLRVRATVTVKRAVSYRLSVTKP
jgi:hypothetical protein